MQLNENCRKSCIDSCPGNRVIFNFEVLSCVICAMNLLMVKVIRYDIKKCLCRRNWMFHILVLKI